MPGCVEHLSVVILLKKGVRDGKKDFTVLYLDLADAFGPVSHKLIQDTLKLYYILNKVVELVKDNYEDFTIKLVKE